MGPVRVQRFACNRRYRGAGLLTVAAFVLASFWADAVTVTFKEQAYVKGPSIELGEVAEIEGENTESLSSIEVGLAPPPRESRQLTVDLIVARIKNAGMDAGNLEVKGSAVVKATTLHQELSSEAVGDSLRKFIEDHIPWEAKDTNIDLTVNVPPLIVPDGAIVFDWRPDPGYRYLGAGTFRGTPSVDGKPQKTVVCKATIEAYANVLVAATVIPRGQSLGVTNVKIERLALSTLRDEPIRGDAAADDVLQLVARRDIAAGDVVTKALVTPRVIVKRRQLVTVESMNGGIQIRTQAQAQSDGAEGDVVVCTNLNSKQAFQGVVRRDGVVVVSQ